MSSYSARHIVAIVVSSFFGFAVAIVVWSFEFKGRDDRITDYMPAGIGFLLFFLLFLLTIGAVLLLRYGINGIRGRKIQPQDKASKEDITRLETSINRLEKKVDEILRN